MKCSALGIIHTGVLYFLFSVHFLNLSVTTLQSYTCLLGIAFAPTLDESTLTDWNPPPAGPDVFLVQSATTFAGAPDAIPPYEKQAQAVGAFAGATVNTARPGMPSPPMRCSSAI